MAVLPLFPAFDPVYSLDAPLGRRIYAVCVVVGIVWMIVARLREEDNRKAEWEAKHQAILAAIETAFNRQTTLRTAEIQALRVLDRAPLPETPRLIEAIEESTAREYQSFVSYRTDLLNGFEGSSYYTPPTPPSSHITESLQRIAANPPTTPEAVQHTIVQLQGTVVGGMLRTFGTLTVSSDDGKEK